jgi:hypothetical protein
LTWYERAKFRVKIKSLAEEARIIRREEGRALARAAYFRKALGPATVELTGGALVTNKTYDAEFAYHGIHGHRVSVVRSESRSSLLAYACCRGVPYSSCERPRREIDAKRVAEIVRSLTGQTVRPEDLKTWAEHEV